jgi:hypothetical protein
VTKNKIRLIPTVLVLLFIFASPLGSLFLPVAEASSSKADIGLVAWTNVGQSIDLNQARKLFTTISSETADEIVGTYSVYVNNYATENINLYVGRTGLIAGYYDSYTPASKTILWNSDKILFSKLAAVITVGQSLGYTISVKDIKYYDYRYPDANRIMMVTQSLGESSIGNYDYGSFNFNIPNSATVYETSYSIYLNDIYNAKPATTVAIDGSIIGSISGSGSIYDVYNGYIMTNTQHIFGVMSNLGAQSAAAMIMIYNDNSGSSKNGNILVNNYDYWSDNKMTEPIIPTTGTAYTPTYTAPPKIIATPKAVVTMPLPKGTVQETEVVPGMTAKETEKIPDTPRPTQEALRKPPKVSVDLHGERTNIELGQESLLKGSIVSFNTNRDKMHAQIVIIPPSGVSVVSADFVKSPAGQYASDFELDPGKGKDIEVTIIPNEVGEFKVSSKITYYFGDNKDDNGYEEVKLDIKARPKGSPGSSSESGSSTSGNVGQTTQAAKSNNTPKEEPGFEIMYGIGTLSISFLFTKFFLKNK